MSLRNEARKVAGLAAEDLSAVNYRFIYQSGISTSAKTVKAPLVSLAGDAQNGADEIVYLLKNSPKLNQEARCLQLGTGNGYLEVDAAYAAGDLLMIGANGVGTALAGTTKYARAKVVEPSSASGDIIEVETLNPSIAGS